MKKKFLSAEWRKLILVNYNVNPSVLKNYLPKHTELDLWKGTCYVSLVGFMFLNTKVKGCKIPGHINFEEVNLRFYVKRIIDGEARRGVAFIKEIVPKKLITTVAKKVYQEPYETCPMEHFWDHKEESLKIVYKWKTKNFWNHIQVCAKDICSSFEQGSEADFITEHYWGYTKINNDQTNEYEVAHPSWKTYDIIDYHINVDFTATYGEEFAFLSTQNPLSVLLAEGSDISVGNKSKLQTT